MATPASTTAAGIARRFTSRHLRAVEEAVGTVNTEWVSRLSPLRRRVLLRCATIDGDTTDVEVYGRSKQGVAHAYTGALNLRPHLGHWAEAGVPLAAELRAGPRTHAATAWTFWTARSRRCRPEWTKSGAVGTPATSPPTWPRPASSGACSSRSARSAPGR